jgi:peptidase E
MRRILAIGGGGFMMEDGSPIDAHIYGLAGKANPRVCFIPTPSGDLSLHIEKFHTAFKALGARTSHLTLFRKASDGSLPLNELAEQLLQQDVIYVGGGNTKSALAVWREWGVDIALRAAWEHGVLLAGMSAGALCWFETGITDSFGGSEYKALPCLGLLPGACSVHYSSDTKRRISLHNAMRSSGFAASIAIDDHAAVLYHGSERHQVLSWHEGATAYCVDSVENGPSESALAATTIVNAARRLT